MNRNLFCTLVLVFCIILSFGMAACESRSGHRADEMIAQRATIKPVKVVILRFVKTLETKDYSTFPRMYKVRIVPSDSLTHYLTTTKYVEVGDTLMARPLIDFN